MNLASVRRPGARETSSLPYVSYDESSGDEIMFRIFLNERLRVKMTEANLSFRFLFPRSDHDEWFSGAETS